MAPSLRDLATCRPFDFPTRQLRTCSFRVRDNETMRFISRACDLPRIIKVPASLPFDIIERSIYSKLDALAVIREE